MVSSSNCWKYDVFLSFRGQETRNTFTAHLYYALCNKGINAFIDDKLERGEHITSQLYRVIEDSRISLLIFSENYARSIYCLDELVKILECKESKGQVVFPVFYNGSFRCRRTKWKFRRGLAFPWNLLGDWYREGAEMEGSSDKSSSIVWMAFKQWVNSCYSSRLLFPSSFLTFCLGLQYISYLGSLEFPKLNS